jgi:hypothetical protein
VKNLAQNGHLYLGKISEGVAKGQRRISIESTEPDRETLKHGLKTDNILLFATLEINAGPAVERRD